MTEVPTRRTVWIVAIVAVLAFANAIDARFAYDDLAYVQTNASVIGDAGIFTEATPPQRKDLGLYRPVTVWTYWVQHAITGLDPRFFHALNVLLHALASMLVLRVATHVGSSRSAALVAGLVFATHPVHVEAVAWIVGRAEILATIFALLALLAHGKPTAPTDGRRVALAATAYALACLSKETALPWPAALFLLDVIGRAGTPWRRVFARQIPFAIVCVAICVLRVAVLGHFAPNPTLPDLAHVQETARGALILGVAGKALTALVAPLGLSVYYNPARFVEQAAQLRGLIAIAAVVFVVVVAWRRRVSTLLCATAIGAVATLPFLQLVPIGAVFGDRFLYLPSVGFALALAVLLPIDSPRAVLRAAARTVAGLLIVVGLGLTWMRNTAFADDLALWQDALAAAPNESLPHFQVGKLYFERGQLEYQNQDLKGAVFHLSESLRIDPRHEWAGNAHVALGECAAGKRGDPLQKHVDAFAAAAHYRAALPLLGDDPVDALLNLAALHRTEAVDDAEARACIAIVLDRNRDATSVANAKTILAELDADAAALKAGTGK